MKIEEIKVATGAQLEQRMASISTEMQAEDADLDALTAEVEAIEQRQAALKAGVEKRNALMQRIAKGSGTVKESRSNVTKTNAEIVKTTEYVNAYARYMKTGDDTEARALLTENVTGGQIPVPEMVYGVIEAAWEKNTLLSYVRKTYFKGNFKLGFERSATDASWHVEGTDAPDEETLLIGLAEIKPQTVKKWITLSTEVLENENGEEVLRYIYDEITNKITAKIVERVINTIYAAPTTSTATQVARAEIATADVVGTVADFIDAKALLGDDAVNVIAVMTRAKEAAYKKAALAGNFAVDPFDGLTVVTSSKATLPIVGDFNAVLVNLPAGDLVKFIYDELTYAEADMVKIVGRESVGIGLVKPGCMVTIGTPAQG